MKLLSRFAKDESGATAIEYGLIASLMAVIVIGAFALLDLNGVFRGIMNTISPPAAGG